MRQRVLLSNSISMLLWSDINNCVIQHHFGCFIPLQCMLKACLIMQQVSYCKNLSTLNLGKLTYLAFWTPYICASNDALSWKCEIWNFWLLCFPWPVHICYGKKFGFYSNQNGGLPLLSQLLVKCSRHHLPCTIHERDETHTIEMGGSGWVG